MSWYVKLINALGPIAMIILVFAVVCLVVSVPVWLLWNWLMPVIFGLPKITLLQALGLAFLSTLLFKNGYSAKTN